jgi:antitoxin StbD
MNMAAQILVNTVASISELKANPMKTVETGEGSTIAILNRNTPAFYCVPAKVYEEIMDRLEDAELVALIRERIDDEEDTITVEWEDL